MPYIWYATFTYDTDEEHYTIMQIMWRLNLFVDTISDGYEDGWLLLGGDLDMANSWCI
jgi:hypothetical protein